MKKLLSLAFILAFSLSFAQNKVWTMTRSGDTITNTGTDHLDVTLSSYAKTVSIQAVVTKLSGTVAGTGLLQGSIDGTNFVNIGTDTLKNTDQTTNTKLWVIDNSPYLYYRIAFAGSGTMSARIKGYALTQLTGKDGQGVVSNFKSSYGATTDSVTNTGTNYVTVQVQNWYYTTTIQPVVTKLSGTAAGTVTLQGSNDGTNFVTVNTSYISGGSATMSVSNQTTNTKLFVITGSPYRYYRLSYTGSGTMLCTLKGYAFTSK